VRTPPRGGASLKSDDFHWKYSIGGRNLKLLGSGKNAQEKNQLFLQRMAIMAYQNLMIAG
jgi:hypothetical protein